MPYCEFIIKSIAYKRMDIDRWKHTRKIAFFAYVGSHVDPKGLPKSEDKFMQLDNDFEQQNKKTISEEHRNKFLEEFSEYNRIFNSKLN